VESTITTPHTEAPETAEVTQAPEVTGVTAEVEGHPQMGPDPEARRFLKAILLGVALGIVIMAVLIGVAVKLIAPDTEPLAIVGIALWVALFCGPFVAGTVTVGLSSKH
jgi:hypothetical protein